MSRSQPQNLFCMTHLYLAATVSSSALLLFWSAVPNGCFRFENGVFKVTDCGSTNGTFLQQQKIAPNVAHQIQDGEQIVLGGGAIWQENWFHIKMYLYLCRQTRLVCWRKIATKRDFFEQIIRLCPGEEVLGTLQG